ncbi:MAG: flavin reductase (DIM6/NTAB) family NADH-FMN oxidoreductase RutF [Candidatus Promineifilaceae bacterium]|jgi:flavin reductase (DIM6/NTAB) family NADH-FMN oxidoreductase RutF
MEINPKEISAKEVYKLLTGSVIPRPIAWVSTVSKDGVFNLAPYSFANALSADPPTVMFSGGRPNGNNKDTIQNVLDTKEFVFNIVTLPYASQMNASATILPPEVDEFEVAGLTAAPSKMIKAPRVLESPINFECELSGVHEIKGETGGGSMVIFGRIVHMHIADEVLLPDYKIDPIALNAIGRLSGPSYSKVTDLFHIERLN